MTQGISIGRAAPPRAKIEDTDHRRRSFTAKHMTVVAAIVELQLQEQLSGASRGRIAEFIKPHVCNPEWLDLIQTEMIGVCHDETTGRPVTDTSGGILYGLTPLGVELLPEKLLEAFRHSLTRLSAANVERPVNATKVELLEHQHSRITYLADMLKLDLPGRPYESQDGPDEADAVGGDGPAAD